MACGCNNICGGNYCPANTACYGDEPTCSNSYNFSALPNNAVVVGVEIEAQHLADLEDAINSERADVTRRYNLLPPCLPDTAIAACTNNNFWGSPYPFSDSRSAGDVIDAAHFDNVRLANNEVVNDSGYGTLSSVNPAPGDTILASQITQLQSDINGTRNACICNSFASCSPHCCNIYCPSDDPVYP